MNKELILKVADAIEKESVAGLGFNMRFYAYQEKCRTVSYIAGWTVLLANDLSPKKLVELDQEEGSYHTIRKMAREALGLTDREAGSLFVRAWLSEEVGEERTDGKLDRIPASHAVRVLRNLAETGVVGWGVGG